jgi:LmbE family N-acetylglucosaminyl deacetylase
VDREGYLTTLGILLRHSLCPGLKRFSQPSLDRLAQVSELVAHIPIRALAVYAHPDDAEVSCGGTLARWAAAGAQVHLVVCTRGDKGSSDPNTDPEVLALQRREEVAAAAQVLGLATHHRLEWPDGELENTLELRGRLVGLVRRFRPEVVVCPDPTAVIFGDTYFNHHDHRMVGWATLDAVAPAAANPHYFPDAGPAHQASYAYLSGTLEPNIWVDVTSSLDTKIAAVACHRSQLTNRCGWFGAFLRERAEEVGRQVGVPVAEVFRRLVLAS